jgi:NAD(P)-dependent dehydrogenase (short-subunit alcohol dehydrogenase family)
MRAEGIFAPVTGGASGLGRATAARLLTPGERVVIVDLPGAAGAEVAASLGAGVRSVVADVTDPQQVEQAIKAALEFGSLPSLYIARARAPVRLVEKGNVPAHLRRSPKS